MDEANKNNTDRTYRTLLREELELRQSKNKGYSLRAFSRDIGIHASQVSGILHARCGLSHERALEICARLGWKGKKKNIFCALVELEEATHPEIKEKILRKIQRSNDSDQNSGVRPQWIEVDQFNAISDWYHFPILVLPDLPNFEMSPQKISEYLGITPVQAQAALERLIRLELLKATPIDHRYERSSPTLRVQSPLKNTAIRKNVQAMLKKASQAMENQEPGERIAETRSFAVDSQMLPEVRNLVAEFDQKLQVLTEKMKNPDSVYHLDLMVFRLNQKDSPKQIKNRKQKEKGEKRNESL